MMGGGRSFSCKKDCTYSSSGELDSIKVGLPLRERLRLLRHAARHGLPLGILMGRQMANDHNQSCQFEARGVSVKRIATEGSRIGGAWAPQPTIYI
jgi:hypothetical protein